MVILLGNEIGVTDLKPIMRILIFNAEGLQCDRRSIIIYLSFSDARYVTRSQEGVLSRLFAKSRSRKKRLLLYQV